MLGNVRRVEEPEYPTDGVRVQAVELCLALAREAVLEVIESGKNDIDDLRLALFSRFFLRNFGPFARKKNREI